ncbi:hypothetical protein AWZ03_015032, partial [Drosophila navojoa]
IGLTSPSSSSLFFYRSVSDSSPAVSGPTTTSGSNDGLGSGNGSASAVLAWSLSNPWQQGGADAGSTSATSEVSYDCF